MLSNDLKDLLVCEFSSKFRKCFSYIIHSDYSSARNVKCTEECFNPFISKIFVRIDCGGEEVTEVDFAVLGVIELGDYIIYFIVFDFTTGCLFG